MYKKYNIVNTVSFTEFNYYKFSFIKNNDFYKTYLYKVIEIGSLDLFKLIYPYVCYDNHDFYKIYEMTMKSGSYNLFRYIEDLVTKNNFYYSQDSNIYELAIQGNSLEICKFLYDKGYRFDNHIFHYAVENNCLEICKWLYSKGGLWKPYIQLEDKRKEKYGRILTTNKDFYVNTFNVAVINNAVEMCELLYNMGCNNWHDKTFYFACLTGSLELCQWLYSKNCPYDKYIFDYAIQSNSYNLCKWLYEIGLFQGLSYNININNVKNIILRNFLLKITK